MLNAAFQSRDPGKSETRGMESARLENTVSADGATMARDRLLLGRRLGCWGRSHRPANPPKFCAGPHDPASFETAL
jgi:hypothetical protein